MDCYYIIKIAVSILISSGPPTFLSCLSVMWLWLFMLNETSLIGKLNIVIKSVVIKTYELIVETHPLSCSLFFSFYLSLSLSLSLFLSSLIFSFYLSPSNTLFLSTAIQFPFPVVSARNVSDNKMSGKLLPQTSRTFSPSL